MSDKNKEAPAAQKPKKAKIPTKSYLVIKTIVTDKKTYAPGDKIELTEKGRRFFKQQKKIK